MKVGDFARIVSACDGLDAYHGEVGKVHQIDDEECEGSAFRYQVESSIGAIWCHAEFESSSRENDYKDSEKWKKAVEDAVEIAEKIINTSPNLAGKTDTVRISDGNSHSEPIPLKTLTITLVDGTNALTGQFRDSKGQLWSVDMSISYESSLILPEEGKNDNR